MKFNVENYTFSFVINDKKYILIVDDESCEYGCTFSVMIRDSNDISDLRKRLDKKNLKYHIYEVTNYEEN